MIRPAFFMTVAIVLTAQPAIDAQDVSPQDAARVSRAASLLKRPAVRNELGLAGAQIAELIRLEADRQGLLVSQLELNQLTIEERTAAYNEFKRQMRELGEQAIAVLLPHQRDRLDQIMRQEAMRTSEAHVGLTDPRLIEHLGLAEPQLQVIRTKAMEADAKLKERLAVLLKEIEQAKQQARDEVLGSLTPQQRKTYEEFIGEPFDLRQMD
jgi:hypothetical protein